MTAFADEIGADPMVFSLLEIFDGELGYLRPPESTTERHCDHCVVTFAVQILTVERGQEPLPLTGGQSVPDAHSMLIYALPSSTSDEFADRMIVRALRTAGG